MLGSRLTPQDASDSKPIEIWHLDVQKHQVVVGILAKAMLQELLTVSTCGNSML